MTSLNIPRTLSNNTVADANYVMDNFNAVRDFTNVEVVRTDGSVKANTNAIADDAVTTAKIAAGAITDAKLNSSLSLPRGRIAYQTRTTDSAYFTSGQADYFTGITFTPTVGRAYRVSVSLFSQVYYVDYGVDNVVVAIINGSGTALQYIVPPIAGGFFVASPTSHADSYIFIPTTNASVTFNARMAIVGGAPGCKIVGGAGYQNSIVVEDIGPA